MEECRPILNTGLRGFSVATTKISDVDGAAGKLSYRGYLAKDLAGKVGFEETIYLLLYEKLPNKIELSEIKSQLAENMHVPDFIIEALKLCPKDALPMDVLQSAVTMLAHHDPDVREHSREATMRICQSSNLIRPKNSKPNPSANC